ncbi:hypothetical protein ABEB36_013877 [Hypothenemus hampei]
MTGSTRKYEERGLIPRSLQDIFSSIEKLQDKPIIYISYMEIYNEVCYDLLSPREPKVARNLEELPRVWIQENKDGTPQTKNLSVLPVNTEEEAMRLFFLGDTNRVIAETPLNEYSSRSHCIFTIYVRLSCRFSKLNLVDLAGSERVCKRNISGNVLQEAKHINLSLHFLQQVILALSDSKRNHIPYRNSLMTFVLKDSLGGNCYTVMMATVSGSKNNLLESISTCKFAQRVAMIKLDPVVNEILDPQKEIELLKREIQDLRQELGKTQNVIENDIKDEPFSTKEKQNIEKKLESYLNKGDDAIFKTRITLEGFHFCLETIKRKFNALVLKKELITRGEDQEFYHEKQQSHKQSDQYAKMLRTTYDKAKTLASTIEECQINIKYLREKLDLASKHNDKEKMCFLTKELENEQTLYKKSLIELKEIKNEALLLETGLKKINSVQNLNIQTHSSVQNGEQDHCKQCLYEMKMDMCSFKNNIQNSSFEKCPLRNPTVYNFDNDYYVSRNCQQDVFEIKCTNVNKQNICSCDFFPHSEIKLIPEKLYVPSTNENIKKPYDCNELGKYLDENTNHRYEIFLDSDTEEFKNFINTIKLTGDEEVDKGICDFYRNKLAFH